MIHTEFKKLYQPAADDPFAMEIEFKITSENKLAIKQARPWVFRSESQAGDTSEPPPTVTISGTAQVGQTLTADTSGITDEDGLTNVSYRYQWVRNDGNANTDIKGATASTHELSDSDEGKTVKVKVSFTDDANNEESRTSAATATVAPQACADGDVPVQPIPVGPPQGRRRPAPGDRRIQLAGEVIHQCHAVGVVDQRHSKQHETAPRGWAGKRLDILPGPRRQRRHRVQPGGWPAVRWGRNLHRGRRCTVPRCSENPPGTARG